MRLSPLSSILFGLSTTIAGVACSSSNTSGSGGAGGAIVGPGATSTSSSSRSSSSSSGAPCPGETIASAASSEFCQATAVPLDCSAVTPALPNEVCGVFVGALSTDLARSTMVKEFAGSGPPELACLASAGYPPKANPAASSSVTMSGVVEIFSSGCESNNVEIEVFEVAPDGGVGATVGNAVTTSSDCSISGVAEANATCGTRYLCKYSYPSVPTEKQLLVRTSGTQWASFNEYGVYASNADAPNGTWQRNLRALSSDDYSIIPAVATGGPITPGHGAIFGEVHDCGDVRLLHAVANIDAPKTSLTYFASNEATPLPDLSATGTSATGLFAAIDVAPGKVAVAAAGNVGGQATALGFTHVTVFPNAVTFVTLRGVEPYQVP